MGKQQIIRQIGELYQQIRGANVAIYQLWKHNILFHWDWWISLALTVLPWLLWLKIRPIESTWRLLLVGFYVTLITCCLNFTGITLGWWYYTGNLIPTFPAYFPYDFSIFPVLIMLMLQYKPTFSPLIKAAVFSGFTSFLFEPLFTWAGYYIPTGWRHIYSFPIYLVIYLIAHWLSKRNGFKPLA